MIDAWAILNSQFCLGNPKFIGRLENGMNPVHKLGRSLLESYPNETNQALRMMCACVGWFATREDPSQCLVY